MKTVLTIILFFSQLMGLSAQNDKSPFDFSYYRLDNSDSLEIFSMNRIKGNLLYYWLDNDSINGLIIPITIYNAYNEWTKDYSFDFIYTNDSTINRIETIGKLDKTDDFYYSDLRFFKRELFNYYNIEYIDSTKRIKIVSSNNNLLIDDKLFKKDSTGRIFQSFTGY